MSKISKKFGKKILVSEITILLKLKTDLLAIETTFEIINIKMELWQWGL